MTDFPPHKFLTAQRAIHLTKGEKQASKAAIWNFVRQYSGQRQVQHMDADISHFFGPLRGIALKPSEKKTILLSVKRNAVLQKDRKKSKAPSWINMFVTPFLFGARGLTMTLAVFLVLILSSGVFTYVAEAALPGDALYGFKVHVAEPIRHFLYRSPEARAAWRVERMERRLQEAEYIAKERRGAEAWVQLSTEFAKQGEDMRVLWNEKDEESSALATATSESVLTVRATSLHSLLKEADAPVEAAQFLEKIRLAQQEVRVMRREREALLPPSVRAQSITERTKWAEEHVQEMERNGAPAEAIQQVQQKLLEATQAAGRGDLDRAATRANEVEQRVEAMQKVLDFSPGTTSSVSSLQRSSTRSSLPVSSRKESMVSSARPRTLPVLSVPNISSVPALPLGL